MNKSECQQLVDSYLTWLRRGVTAAIVGDGVCELTTPFLDRHNDHVQIYALRTERGILLTDDGEVLDDLRSSGVDLSTEKRQAMLQATLRGHGVRAVEGRLEVEATNNNVGQRAHSLIQAMLAVNDLYVLARTRVASLFWEDVRGFLDQHGIRYTPRVKLTGKSGYDHAIDFVIPRSNRQPERVIQAVPSPQKSAITNFLFVLSDTLGGREDDVRAYAFLNDAIAHQVSSEVLEALESYNVRPAFWSRREEYAEELAS